MTTQMTVLDLVQILHDFSVEEFGGRFLYLPWEHRPCARKARAWMAMLSAKGLVRGGPWRVLLEDVHPRSRAFNPSLFDGRVPAFEVYRIDQDALSKAFVA